ncbi:MAG: hypothetical protein EZS28_032373 [Streblomastix strix]|uniref:Uncharacterized protein n=1 Tax=Streblomastix strix TaxID=222440 RepID=A0A5J4UPW3_9EUKA|nr:MAG: hypothetical protein EZS28_032373 [Streblomastix strix]
MREHCHYVWNLAERKSICGHLVDLEYVSSRSDGQKITWSLIRRIHLQQMIKTANFHGVDYFPVNSQFVIYCLDRFAKYFDAFEMKQLRDVELSDKELFEPNKID